MATAPSRWNAGRILLVVFGSILLLIGLAVLAGGGALIWADAAKRDDQGYFTTSKDHVRTATYALASDDLDIGEDGPGWLVDNGDLARIRIRATSGKPVFLGIGRSRDVSRFLTGTSFAVVRDVHYDPFDVEVRPAFPANGRPRDPAAQGFWVASASGAGTQTVTWDVEGGSWSALLMNVDGSRGVSADVDLGVRISWLIWAAVGIVAFGALLVAGGGAMIFFGARRPGGAVAVAAPGGEQMPLPIADAQSYPVVVEGELDPGLSRWLWLVKWLLAIPHYIVLFFLWIAFVVLTIAAFFAILFTGRYPRSMFDFNVGVLRWSWRVGFYATNALATDRYPPFTLDRVPDYPAQLEVEYPERLSRGLIFVKWLLAVPHYCVLSVLVGGWPVWFSHWGGDVRLPGLLGLLVFIAAIVLLFTRRYPRDIFELVRGINRWFFRVVSYVALMRDEYPPFRLGR
jgi:hypothetical protein